MVPNIGGGWVCVRSTTTHALETRTNESHNTYSDTDNCNDLRWDFDSLKILFLSLG